MGTTGEMAFTLGNPVTSALMPAAPAQGAAPPCLTQS
jgi:hypothetical protein